MKPNIKQLQKILSSGNNSLDYVLILNLDGEFKLIRGSGAEAVNGLEYVSRWETFDAGNDYVGINASKDEKLLTTLMKWADEVWNKYIETNKYPILNKYV